MQFVVSLFLTMGMSKMTIFMVGFSVYLGYSKHT